MSMPAVPLAARPAPGIRLNDDERRLTERMRLLSWLSLGYMTFAGATATLSASSPWKRKPRPSISARKPPGAWPAYDAKRTKKAR